MLRNIAIVIWSFVNISRVLALFGYEFNYRSILDIMKIIAFFSLVLSLILSTNMNF